MWQLDRAEQKEDILQEFEARGKEAPVELAPPVGRPQDWRHRRVRLEGRFDSAHQFLLDNRVSGGRAGYHVLTPLRVQDSRAAVLVNRGWVPVGPNRARLPDVEVGDRARVLTGTVYVPYGQGFHLGDMDTGENWPRRIQFLDFERMEGLLGYPLTELTVRLNDQASDGYRREWRAVPFGPERHLGYAVQWMALALAIAVIWLVLTLRGSKGP